MIEVLPKSITRLVSKFESTARASRGFYWMGMVAGNNPERGRELDVYLSERTGKRLPLKVQEAVADVVEVFDDLVWELEELPPPASLSLHLIRTSELSPRQLKRRLEKLCEGNPTRSLVYQQSFR